MNFSLKWIRKFSPIFHENDMEFKISCQLNLMLKADSLRLEQIFMNLLDNAMKYSERGSTIALTAWKHEKRNSYRH